MTIWAFSQKTGRVQPLEKPNSAVKALDFIDVNVAPYPPSTFTPFQLVKDVLIAGGSSCVTPNVSNVNVYPASTVADGNRPWGYFNKGTANFPFNAGIVLSTGFATNAGNSLAPNNSDNLETIYGNSGDMDLADAIGANNNNLNDAVYLEFDFVPTSTEVKFNYIFASEEYTTSFPCTYTDGFALLLKKVGDPTFTNLAVLPAGAGAVSVTNIRPSTTYDGGPLSCGSLNDTYFAGYNNPITGHNFNGSVVPLEAKATVIPGQTYRIKMVLADYSDNSYDSAVFLEAGSFNIGVQIVGAGGVALPSTLKMCDNSPQVLTAAVSAPGATFQWTLNGTPIPGATQQSYTATQPGIYCVQATVPGSTCPAVACVTIEGGTSPVVQDVTYTLCHAPGNIIYNLSAIENAISTTPGVTFTYYLTQAQAQAGGPATIPTPAAFSSAGAQDIWVRVAKGFCFKLAKIRLEKAPEIVVNITPPAILNCTNPTTTLQASTSVYPAGSTFQWTATNGGTILSGGTTLTPTVGSAGQYTLTITKTYQPGNVICTGSNTVTVQGDGVRPTTTVSASAVKVCSGESVVLTATGGTTYLWVGQTVTGNTITVNPTSTTTYQVYAIGDNGCPSVDPATVTVTVFPNIPVIQGSFSFNTLTITAANPGGAALEYSINNGATWQNSNVFTNVPNNVVVTMMVRIKDSHCVYSDDFLTLHIPNVITPNGDNVNDYIDFTNLSLYNGFSATVFDRYGKNVWTATKSSPVWDGHFQGKRLPTGTYWYVVQYENPVKKNPEVHKGWVLLKNFE